MKKQLEEALMRELTEAEIRFIEWLGGWERETLEAAQKLFADMYAAGQADANFAHAAIDLGERQD